MRTCPLKLPLGEHGLIRMRPAYAYIRNTALADYSLLLAVVGPCCKRVFATGILGILPLSLGLVQPEAHGRRMIWFAAFSAGEGACPFTGAESMSTGGTMLTTTVRAYCGGSPPLSIQSSSQRPSVPLITCQAATSATAFGTNCCGSVNG